MSWVVASLEKQQAHCQTVGPVEFEESGRRTSFWREGNNLSVVQSKMNAPGVQARVEQGCYLARARALSAIRTCSRSPIRSSSFSSSGVNVPALCLLSKRLTSV